LTTVDQINNYQQMILIAAKIISHYEKEQLSLRNAMKLFSKIAENNQLEFYSQVHALVFETVRHQNIINRIIHYYIQRFLDERIPVEIRNLLRVITYILTLSRDIKENDWNEVCKKTLDTINMPELDQELENYFIHLQNLQLDLLIDKIKDPEEKLSVRYSHPTWLIRDFNKFYGTETTLNILKSNNQILPVYLRLNLFTYSKEEIIARLNEEDVEVENDPNLYDVVKIVSYKTPLPRLNSFTKGLYYVQNKGSSLVSHVLDPKTNEKVIDACAAPGGKTTHIAMLQKDKGYIIALDNHLRRMYELKKKIKLYKLKSIRPIIYDLRLGNIFGIKFDKILIDAPCSGSGTFSSRPDSKWRVDRHQTKWLSKLQYKLLSNVSIMLKRDQNASLVYSTCSLHPLENESVIRRFLDNNLEFELKPQKLFIGTPSPEYPLAQRLFPHINQTEGFSIFKLGWKSD
jgi:16S rRNA (cytosine967-C5)-methyltransferase